MNYEFFPQVMRLFSQTDRTFVPLAGDAFLLEVGARAAGQLIEVHLVRVELRPINTGEPNLPAHGDPASSAHPVPSTIMGFRLA